MVILKILGLDFFICGCGFDRLEIESDTEGCTKQGLGTDKNSSGSECSECESFGELCYSGRDPELGDILDSLDIELDICCEGSDWTPELVGIFNTVDSVLECESDTLDRYYEFELEKKIGK